MDKYVVVDGKIKFNRWSIEFDGQVREFWNDIEMHRLIGSLNDRDIPFTQTEYPVDADEYAQWNDKDVSSFDDAQAMIEGGYIYPITNEDIALGLAEIYESMQSTAATDAVTSGVTTFKAARMVSSDTTETAETETAEVITPPTPGKAALSAIYAGLIKRGMKSKSDVPDTIKATVDTVMEELKYDVADQ
jgi:hypothetical protein